MCLGIAIYLFKRDSEYNDICLILIPALVSMVDIRPIFFVLMMLIEFSLLPDYQSIGFCVISVFHLVLWKLYFVSTFKFESEYSGESKIIKFKNEFLVTIS